MKRWRLLWQPGWPPDASRQSAVVSDFTITAGKLVVPASEIVSVLPVDEGSTAFGTPTPLSEPVPGETP